MRVIAKTPKKFKFLKGHLIKVNKNGQSLKGTQLTKGSIGLKILEAGYITWSELEAIRKFLNKNLKKKGKIWFKVQPYAPVSKKPIGVRMGKGKGPTEFYVVPVKPGFVLFELDSQFFNLYHLAKLISKVKFKLGLNSKIIYLNDFGKLEY